MSLFGNIAQPDAAVHVREALCLQTNVSTGRNSGTSWKRLPGRPRKTWTSQIPDDTGMALHAYWETSICRGHGRGTLWSRLHVDDDDDDDNTALSTIN